MDRRIVVTGLGAMTPLGIHIDTVWERICRGVSGIHTITRFDTTDFPVRIAGEARDFVPEHYLDKRDIRRTDRFVQFALAASQEAVQDAELTITAANADRVGVYIGTAFGGLAYAAIRYRSAFRKNQGALSFSQRCSLRLMDFAEFSAIAFSY